MSQRFTLDRSSFEKFLAAAWVLQCLHDQLPHRQVGGDETLDELLRTQKPAEVGNSVLQEAVRSAVQFPPTAIDSAPDMPNRPPAHAETLAEPVEIQLPIETGILNFDVAVDVEFRTAEIKKSLHAKDVATPHASQLPLHGLEVLANEHEENDKEWVRRRPVFNLRTADLRNGLSCIQRAVSNLRPAFRVNLTLNAVRAAAIATPVLLLAIVAASLLLATGRHQPLHNAQAASTPSKEAVVSDNSTTLTTTTGIASRYTPTTGNAQPRRTRRFRPSPSLEVSHKHVTERATLSVVQGLSRYEISGLRRQAKYGDTSASFTLGMAYELGRNVPQDCGEAARWVTKAALAGNTAAQYNLGLRYREGDGVPANRAESEKWLRKATVHRNRQAKLALKVLARR